MGRTSAAKKIVRTDLEGKTGTLLPPASFTNSFFTNLLRDDLATLSRAERQRLTASIWQLAQRRPKGTVNLRLFNPTQEKDGWAVDHTVLEIVNDDMPFLLDSVTGELQRRGLTVHLSIHPVQCVRRDAKGHLLGMSEGFACEEGDHPECFMHIQFDRCLDSNSLDEIAQALRQILDDVRASVEDWGAMRDRLKETAAALHAPKGTSLANEDIAEAKSFLTWFDDNHFTFLGYRKLDLIQEGDQMRWKVIGDSGLGILRDENVRLFGGLRDLSSQPAGVKSFLREQRLIVVVKTNQRSHVHRSVPMDALFVQRYDEAGNIIGEHLFVGLFTATAYAQSAREIPYLRRKILQVVARANFDPKSHNGKALAHTLDDYPRDELFQIDTDDLLRHSLGIVQLQERARVALFLRRDPFGRFVTALLYVPRERYDSALRTKIEKKLESAFQGDVSDTIVRVDHSRLARIFMTIIIGTDAPHPDHGALESSLRELCRTWQDRLLDSLQTRVGNGKALSWFRRYGEAFPPSYRGTTSPAAAVDDIQALEQTNGLKKRVVELSLPNEQGLVRLKLFQPDQPLDLSEVLPLIENMGLNVEYTAGPHEIAPKDTDAKIYAHAFICRAGQKPVVPFPTLKPLFEEAFERVWTRDVENDVFNALTLRAGLPWREVVALRAMARYLRQLRIPYSHEMMGTTLLAHPETTRLLVELFLTNHDPDWRGDRVKPVAALTSKINERLAAITAIEEDRIVRRYLNLIQAALRTNYFQRAKDGTPKTYLSIKFNSRAIDYIPLPKPLVEIFVYSPRVEAVHLRGGKVARGGIRWSDRRDDFRNEILGLMKAQMVKNTVIVPLGSKGGFIVKQPPAEADKFHAEGVACYRTMMCGLLDLTDNRVGNKIVSPERVVRHDGDDPYLVVAADKGTAKFSDIANGISQEYGFWLDDAFASGGSAGYDHKAMGITARGAWEAVKRHFREIGKDIQTTDFTCVGVGDMSGDVFGNGILLSPHIQMIGAFDHRHIFCDPTPDAAKSHKERARMFELPRSSWADYDRSKISKGGGVFSRTEKSIALSPEIKKAFGLTADSVPPNKLIQAMLYAKVDLLYFGGIGTYVKASDETHEEAGDRANDALRVDGRDLQASVLGEGANLGLTQRGRIEFAMKGGRLNTDAIDNSAGVDTSDHEVNIKILLRKLVTSGQLALPARNKLLASMTDDVGRLVLRDNYLQTQALTVAETQAVTLLPLHARSLRALEKSGLLNRAIEFLPDEAELTERARLGKGLTRPELSVLLAYAKIWLYDQLLASDLPDDAFLQEDLLFYFPPTLQKKYAKEIAQHQLRREIIATSLTNSIINRAGPHFIFAIAERTGASAADIARAYRLVRAAFDLHGLWRDIASLDNKVPTTVQTAMLLDINRMLTHVVPWFLTQGLPEKLTPAIAHYRDGVQKLAAWLAKSPAEIGGRLQTAEQDLLRQGVPATLARTLSLMPYLTTAPDLTRLATQAKCGIDEAAAIFFGLGRRLNLDWLRERAETFTGADTPWQREAVAALLEDLHANQRALATNALGKKTGGKAKGGNDLLSQWTTQNATRLESYDCLLNELRAAPTFDLAMLTLASRALGALV